MYEIKPFTTFPNIPVPTCAYKLKNLNADWNLCTNLKGRQNQVCALNMEVLSQQIQILSNKSSADITQRQAAVLQKLEELQKLLAKKISSDFAALETVKRTNEMEKLPDIIISANPKNVPYSLRAVQNLWKDNIQLNFKFYKHSSLSELSKEAQLFEEQLQHVACNSAGQVLKITLIWMECEETELLSSSILHASIYGEVNLLRFLSRIGPNALRYENLKEANQIDSLLDYCHQFVVSKGTESNLKELSKNLAQYFEKNNEYLFGKYITIADIYLLVVVKQKLKPNFNSKEMPVQFNAWRKRVNDILK